MTTQPPKCPTCQKPSCKEGNPSFPFCSERCKLNDLGRWLDGDYRVAGEPAPIPEENDYGSNY